MLDDDAPTLVELLTKASGKVKGEQDALRLAAVADERVLSALGSGGLLPPSDDVAEALRVLADEKITGWSGRQYLATIRADERDQVLACYPYLVDGIVLNSGDDLTTFKIGAVDLDGIWRGKRIAAPYFIERVSAKGTNICNILFGWHMHDVPIPGLRYTGWQTGYPDITLVPDLGRAGHVERTLPVAATHTVASRPPSSVRM